MSHIQGKPHPAGITEHLDYVRIEVDPAGALSQVAVVTHHSFNGLVLPQHVTVYRLNPVPSQRDLAKVLSATHLGNLSGIFTALTGAATLSDTATDPAPPVPPPR